MCVLIDCFCVYKTLQINHINGNITYFIGEFLQINRVAISPLNIDDLLLNEWFMVF